jgi:alkanesulfonate monooxygenase SsuD/methylene tetrahydromethanopterin reductase-like flavin-dependent oxidoreductase (luciferase family)
MPPRQVVPKPIQKPHPPMWMACTQPESFRIAGNYGLGALSFGFIAPGVLEASLAGYRQASRDAQPVGEFANTQFAATTMALVAPTDEEAVEYGKPGAEFFGESIAALFIPWAKKKDVPESYAYYKNLAQMAEQRLRDRPGFEEQLESGALCMGSVERVKRSVRNYADTGIDQLILMCQVGRVPHEKVMQTIQLFGEEIIPEYR